MRRIIFFTFVIVIVFAGCRSTEQKASETKATVVAGQLKVQRFIGMLTTDVPGEGGAIFSQTVDYLMRQNLAPFLREAPRYMLRVVGIEYKTPEKTGKPLTYALTIEARLTDIDGKCAWPGIVKVEYVNSGSQSEQDICRILAERACADLAKAVPVERATFQEEEKP